MGVKYLFPTLARGDLSPGPADVHAYLAANGTRDTHLDLLGTFGYAVMMRVLKCRKTNGSVRDVG